MGDTPVSDPDGLAAGISALISGEHHDPHGCSGATRPTAKQSYELLNTDAERFGGAGTTMADTILAADLGLHGFDQSAELTLPPLGVLWMCPEGQ